MAESTATSKATPPATHKEIVDAISTVNTKAEPAANYKETVESILVAFILAFIFRAFVVEAFVIPTGSMAPTLYGAHMRLRCPDCGYSFDIGYRGKQSEDNDDVDIPSEITVPIHYHCPNCGYEFPKVDPAGKALTLPVRFGDRILVLKYLYLFQKPVRWDVVVFKSPWEPTHHVAEDPLYEQNFIKRLVGIGPESLVILDGDVYTGPLDANEPVDANGRQLFHIQRKIEYAQSAVWRTIYDNDFIPHLGAQRHPWTQPWREETPLSGWKLSSAPTSDWPAGAPSRAFSFANIKQQSAIQFDADANADSTHALTDYLTYDELEHSSGWQPVNVSDLKLCCDYTRQAGDGPLRLQLSKNADLFTAEFTRGKVKLLKGRRVDPNSPAVSNQKMVGVPAGATEAAEIEVPALAGPGPARLELINVDYRVSVRINGKEVLHTTDAYYTPDVQALWKQEQDALSGSRTEPGPFARSLVRIEAGGQQALVEHLSLARDIYYLTRRTDRFWASVDSISHLKDGEYFVLGDNSFISGDARYWHDPIELPHEDLFVDSGRVPERFMLGKAFFVYWPAGYRLPWIPVNAVPDFGEMRFIH
ncbi:MAG TPA: S26 family signal peptidase [Tepidisphaeraceae bacterium]|nr:S26 family signal peptidase [Tepidisphaeraceae bacterium]